jgi:hypothetical protein
MSLTLPLLQSRNKTEGVDTLQTKWDREHDIKLRENATFGSNVCRAAVSHALHCCNLYFKESLDDFRLLSKIVPWTAVIRSGISLHWHSTPSFLSLRLLVSLCDTN